METLTEPIPAVPAAGPPASAAPPGHASTAETGATYAGLFDVVTPAAGPPLEPSAPPPSAPPEPASREDALVRLARLTALDLEGLAAELGAGRMGLLEAATRLGILAREVRDQAGVR